MLLVTLLFNYYVCSLGCMPCISTVAIVRILQNAKFLSKREKKKGACSMNLTLCTL